ncbi:hybrid sensor histidine kinase/response regulator, partial [Pseudomonas edaphica]
MNHDAIDGIPIDYADLYQQAQQASERLQLALDAGAIIGTWVWDVPADRFTADERFARSFGLSPDLCLKGLPLELVTASIHTDDFAHVQSKVTDALGRGGAYRCEYRVLQSDGVYRWVEANGRVELDEDHKPLRFPGVLIDIEARRVAEAERDRLNTLLRTFTAAVPGVVFAKDRQGRMLVANQGTTELIGKSPEFYIGKTDAEYLDDPEQGRVIMATDRRIMESGLSEQVEEEVRLADGSAATWLSAKAPLFDESGEVIGLIGSSIDVTDRKKAEDALKELNQTLEQRILVAVSERENIEKTLRHSQKMEVVGQLTGGIAHDFNNILAGISGSLELMQTRLAQGRSADVDKYLAVAQSAVKRASALTHRLLAFSRRQTLTPQLTDVKALIEGMVELISRAVGPSISIDVKEMEGLWPALIDSAQLENSLLNLCLNARDSMPDGGRIVISASNEWLEKNDELDHEIVPG